MLPFTLGTAKRPLFGLYEGPDSGSLERRDGVVLCYPMGHEYMSTYPAFKELARGLVQSGFHVLRFDYFGTGDSPGGSDAGDLLLWENDIEAAIDELKDTAGIQRVCLMGLRLGATLALQVSAHRSDVEHLVLWEPITNGRAYVAELKDLRSRYLRQVLPRPKAAIKHGHPFEVMGFPCSERLRSQLEALSTSELLSGAKSALIVAEKSASLARQLDQKGTQVTEVRYDGPHVWDKESEVSGALIPRQTLNHIVDWAKAIS